MGSERVSASEKKTEGIQTHPQGKIKKIFTYSPVCQREKSSSLSGVHNCVRLCVWRKRDHSSHDTFLMGYLMRLLILLWFSVFEPYVWYQRHIFRISSPNDCPTEQTPTRFCFELPCSLWASLSNSGNFSFTTPLTILFQVVYLPSYVLSRIVGNLCVYVFLCLVWSTPIQESFIKQPKRNCRHKIRSFRFIFGNFYLFLLRCQLNST